MDIDDFLKKPEYSNMNEFLDNEFKRTTGDSLYKRIISCFVDESKARNWFYTKSVALGQNRPYDYCLENDRNKIRDEIIRIEHGILS